MALKKLGFKPGFNKQTTASGAEGEWIDGDFVRFRYGLPEKIGGWTQLTVANKTLPGAARAQHTWAAISGEKYAAIGTHKGLFLFYGDAFYDITPLEAAITSCTFSSTTLSPIVTVNKISHGIRELETILHLVLHHYLVEERQDIQQLILMTLHMKLFQYQMQIHLRLQWHQMKQVQECQHRDPYLLIHM
jgi:hypothetical protein